MMSINRASTSGAEAAIPAPKTTQMGRMAPFMEGSVVKGNARVAPIAKWLAIEANGCPYGERTVFFGFLT